MMTKHTPGPWVVKSARSGFYVESQFDVIVDSLDECGRYGAIDNEANARLIAAAPELLKALKALIENVGSCICYDQSEGECLAKAWKMAAVAIAKAEGEQS